MSGNDGVRPHRDIGASKVMTQAAARSTIAPVPGTPGQGWRAMIREERRRLRLTQAQLAAATNLSEETIHKYERGTRTPGREALFRILEALQVPQLRAREILTEAGFAPAERLFPLSVNPDYFFTQGQAAAYAETVPWPRFIVNNVMEIVAANRAARLLWDIDFKTEYATRSRPQLHFLSLMVEPRFASRIVNFDECLAMAISLLKGVPHGGAALENPGPWVQSVLAQFDANDPEALGRLLHAWEIATPAQAKVHFSYRIVWHDPIGGVISFRGVVSDASEPDGLAFSDWIPMDAASHGKFEAAISARVAQGRTRVP